MPSVDVSIVTWNSVSVLRTALDSVFAQSKTPRHVFIVDNASTDGTRELLLEYPKCSVTLVQENVGFAAAHNRALVQSTAEYVLVMNPDGVLQPDYLETLCRFADSHRDGAAFGGMVLRPDGSVDSAGLAIAPWRLVRDVRNRPREPKTIFGVSGALALYRRSALLDVAVEGHFFNSMLFAYKEDVELAWRLQWAGWRSFVVPAAIAQHSRVIQRETKRNQRSVDRRFLSYRNHLLLYPLVETWRTMLFDLWCIIPAECFRFLVLIVSDPIVTFRALAAAAEMWHAARTFAHHERRTVGASRVREAFAP